MYKKILYITRTAIFLALLLVLQYTTKLLGNQIITGSVVNLILILSTLYATIYGGLIIALLSPIFAFILGITPLPNIVLVPIISISNMAYIFVFYLLMKLLKKWNSHALYIFSVIIGSFFKFILMFLGVTYIALPIILESKPVVKHDEIRATITASFTWIQLLTASIGGVVSYVIFNILNKVLIKEKQN